MIRAVNASLEPERVAEALMARVSGWIPRAGWLVLAEDGGGADATDGRRGLAPPLDRRRRRSRLGHAQRRGLQLPGIWARTGGVSDTAGAAAVGFRWRAAGAQIGALVAVDRAPCSPPPASPRDADRAARGHRAGGDCARKRAARATGRSALGHRRPDAAVQLALSLAGAAAGDQARVAKRPAAVAAVRRSGRVQVDQRHARPSVRQPGAGRSGRA